MTGDVALTSALRSNLLTLQDTQRSIDSTQLRLSTGKKVSSALDNPLNFFRSETFSSRADDLTKLLDGIGLSIRTIQEADNGVTAISELLDSAESIIEQGEAAYNGASTNVATISGIASQGAFATTSAATLDTLSGGLSGFAAAGDRIVFTVTGSGVSAGAGTTIGVAGNASIGAIVNGFDSTSGLVATYTPATGVLSIDVRNPTTTGLSGIQEVSVSVADNDGSATTSDPEINFGGTIVRNSSGTADIYAGISTELTNLEERFNKIRTEISATANDASFNGINLLKGNELLTNFNADGTSSLITVGTDLTADGQNIALADFSTRALVTASDTDISDAVTVVENFGATISTDLSLIQNRETFTRNTINTLKAGADDLTLADLNEEGANLLALQTRQQLSITSLSLASQANQAVLRLF